MFNKKPFLSFTEKHFCLLLKSTTPGDAMALILFKFLYCSFYDRKEYSKCSKISIHRFCFYKMLINAVAAQEHML